MNISTCLNADMKKPNLDMYGGTQSYLGFAMAKSPTFDLSIRLMPCVLLVVIAVGCGKGITIDSIDDAASTSISIAKNPFRKIEETTKTKNKNYSESDCTSPLQCVPALLRVTALDISENGLIGYVGEAVPWIFVGSDVNSDKRRLKISVKNLPPEATVALGDPLLANAKVIWTPKHEMQSEKKLEVHLRDMDSCEYELGTGGACNVESSLEKYDFVEAYDWAIKAKNSESPPKPSDEGNGQGNPPEGEPKPENVPNKFTITYDGNGHTGGAPPVDNNTYKSGEVAIVLGNFNQMVKGNLGFLGWNTQANGSGAGYKPGQTITINNTSILLYSMWGSCSFSRTSGTLIGGRCGGRDRFVEESRAMAKQQGCIAFCWNMSCPRGVKEQACENL